ncbi:MAG: VWA domain-containing protein [Labilithrix sp.]|nr:VWA domain-containing protein [Labilithrix sp.]MCW5816719.1 VWA domain-containing protein [Labilithrix sp.]
MRRSFVSIVALGVLSLVGLVHCTAATARSGFADDKKSSTQETSPDDADDDDSGPAFDPSTGGGTPDDSVCTQDIDVVLVLDVSSSMGFVLDKLNKEIPGIVDAANALKAGAHFGFIGYADNGAFGLGGSDAGGRVHTKASTLQKAFSTMKSTYTAKNRNPGDGPTGPETQNPICEENALDSLHLAATEFPWRPSAARVIVIVTDDTFLEGGDNYGDKDGDGDTTDTSYPREGDYPAVHTLADTIKAVKDAKARVFSVTRLKAGSGGLLGGSKCGTGRRHAGNEDSITYGWSKPYAGADPIPTQTDGKNFDLDGIRSGAVSLSDTINGVVLETHCAGDPPK